MNTHKSMNLQSVAVAGAPSQNKPKGHRSLYIIFAMAVLSLLAGCVDVPYYGGGYYGSPYYGGRIHPGYYGIHHGIGHSGFGYGGFGHGGFGHGGFGHGGGHGH